MKTFSKKYLIKELEELAKLGWVKNGRFGNHGGIGNTLEDYLGVKENNLPIPNAAEWELKTQRLSTASLTTLFHIEPSPRAIGFVGQVFLPNYGWLHQEAGKKYSEAEMSFRQTVSGLAHTDRGFIVKVDRKNRKVEISFDASKIATRHKEWVARVNKLVGLRELNPQPYWGFDDLMHKAGTKLLNCFYVQADVKRLDGEEYYHYRKALMLRKFNFDAFLTAIEEGNILVDFDARSGHNHGTKFRLRQNHFPDLYKNLTVVVDEPALPLFK